MTFANDDLSQPPILLITPSYYDIYRISQTVLGKHSLEIFVSMIGKVVCWKMADSLAKAGLYFDELSKIRVLEPEVAQETNELKEECRDFVESK